jgi:predicted O-methyltransferase YrrM
MRWLIKSEEFTNFMYDITDLNRNQMIGSVAQVSGLSISETEKFFIELESDSEFAKKVNERAKNIKRSYELIFPIPYARRIVWYVLIRIFKPRVVIESGTEKGLGSLIIGRALEKNGTGTLYTLDIDLYSGSLITSDENNIQTIIGDSLETIKSIENVDMFIQDSNHEYEFELLELNVIKSKLNDNSIVISDNAHESNALFIWSKQNSRNFVFIPERSNGHWHIGDGIGLSFKSVKL